MSCFSSLRSWIPVVTLMCRQVLWPDTAVVDDNTATLHHGTCVPPGHIWEMCHGRHGGTLTTPPQVIMWHGGGKDGLWVFFPSIPVQVVSWGTSWGVVPDIGQHAAWIEWITREAVASLVCRPNSLVNPNSVLHSVLSRTSLQVGQLDKMPVCLLCPKCQKTDQ